MFLLQSKLCKYRTFLLLSVYFSLVDFEAVSPIEQHFSNASSVFLKGYCTLQSLYWCLEWRGTNTHSKHKLFLREHFTSPLIHRTFWHVLGCLVWKRMGEWNTKVSFLQWPRLSESSGPLQNTSLHSSFSVKFWILAANCSSWWWDAAWAGVSLVAASHPQAVNDVWNAKSSLAPRARRRETMLCCHWFSSFSWNSSAESH